MSCLLILLWRSRMPLYTILQKFHFPTLVYNLKEPMIPKTTMNKKILICFMGYQKSLNCFCFIASASIYILFQQQNVVFLFINFSNMGFWVCTMKKNLEPLFSDEPCLLFQDFSFSGLLLFRQSNWAILK